MTDEKTGWGFNPSFPTEVEVDQNYIWKGDALGRKAFAKPLTNLVNSAGDAPFCIAVDGEWGSGKTFLLKRWCTEFSKQGNKAVYFNAWEDDFHTDPLTVIIGQLWNDLEEGKMKDIGNLLKENWWNTVKEATSNLSYSGVKLGDFRTPARKTMEEYLKGRRSVDVLQKQLQKLAKVTNKKTEKPLVFVVDDLDRCRPTFAIELLERAKHIVGVPGIVFVFGINQKELEKSIKSVYGEIDATDYLHRFFNVNMTLPKAKASDYCQYLIKKHKIDEKATMLASHKAKQEQAYLMSDWPHIIDRMPVVAGYMGLSLRHTEQAVRMLSAVLLSMAVNEEKRMEQLEGYLVVFIFLRIKNRVLYEKFINGDCTVKDALDDIFCSLSREEANDYFSPELEHCIEIIIRAFHLCYEKRERPGVMQEFLAVNKRVKWPEIRFVPKIIVDIKDDNVRRKLLTQLHNWTNELEKINRRDEVPHYLPLRQRIARLLEWGDYWQD